MDPIRSLIALYAGVTLLNLLISLGLYLYRRTPLNRALFLVWVSTISVFFAHAMVPESPGPVALVNGLGFFVNLALANLICKVVGLPLTWIRYSLVGVFGFGVSLLAVWLGQSFLLMSLPICLVAAYPIMDVPARALFRWRRMRLSSKGLVITAILVAVHTVDFAFLRDQPDMVMIGFTIATFLIFGLTLFAMAVVLEASIEGEAKVGAEIEVARKIQMEILPTTPHIPGFEIACAMRSASAVSGDYYDVMRLGSYHWVFLGDVTGHGLGAGLVMFMIQAIVSTILHMDDQIRPGALNRAINAVLANRMARLAESRPVTFMSLRIRDASDLVVSSCHENAFIFRGGSAEMVPIESDLVPVGLGFEGELGIDRFSEMSFSLATNDLFVAVTDGVIEAAKGGDIRVGIYGSAQLGSYITRNAQLPLSQICDGLINELENYTKGVFYDDLTVVLLRRSRHE